MAEFEFELIFKLPNSKEDATLYLDRLYEAGCDDALVGTGRVGMVVLSFSRESVSAQEAVESAISDVNKAIPEVKLVEASPDYVGITELSVILGHSRQNTRKLLLGNAPAPLHAGNPSIWHLSEILEWMRETGLDRRYGVGQTLSDIAMATRKANFDEECARLSNINPRRSPTPQSPKNLAG